MAQGSLHPCSDEPGVMYVFRSLSILPVELGYDLRAKTRRVDRKLSTLETHLHRAL
jgi:hypothetical protein